MVSNLTEFTAFPDNIQQEYPALIKNSNGIVNGDRKRMTLGVRRRK